MVQCSGQSCGSSGSQTIASEAAVGYADMNTLVLDSQFYIKQIPCFYTAIWQWQLLTTRGDNDTGMGYTWK